MPDPTDAAPAHRARLTLDLDGTPYVVRPVPRGRLPPGAVRAFTLTRPDRRLGKVRHRVAEGLEGLACTCGDQQYRQAPVQGLCKHLAACLACGLF